MNLLPSKRYQLTVMLSPAEGRFSSFWTKRGALAAFKRETSGPHLMVWVNDERSNERVAFSESPRWQEAVDKMYGGNYGDPFDDV